MMGSAVVVGDADFENLFESFLPGGYLVVVSDSLGYARTACVVEDAGFEVRDCLNVVLGEGPAGQSGHVLAVLARKPLSGTVAANVVEFGVGGLNIDGCRTAFRSDADRQRNSVATPGERASKGSTQFGGGIRVATQPGGRWPANTLFVHAAGCEHVGSTEDTFGGGKEATSGFVNGYAHDGFVGTTVQSAIWDCLDGCPVAALDKQSGQVKGGTWNRTKGARHFNNDGEATDYKTSGSDKSVGGASRFFLNAEWADTDTGSLPASVLDYLATLITPEGAECLLVGS